MFLLPFSKLFGVDFVDLFSSFVFLDCISPFNICCKAGLEVLNFLNFYLPEKLFISPSVFNESLVRYCNLDCRFFHFSTLNIYCHSLLACRVSAERSAIEHMGFPLYVTCCFSLAAFNILYLCSMSSSNCCFLTCIQISQEAGQVVGYSHLLKNFPEFVVIHTKALVQLIKQK